MTAELAGDDSESCLCLIASYRKRAELIAAVTGETEQRVSLSPVLGDSVDLRYLDLGPEPGEVGDRLRPARTVAAELRAAAVTAGRSHFALIVIDKSASAIEQVLASCGADPFLAGLRMRLAGIASTDDRPAGGRYADIVSSPSGAWSDRGDLAAAVYQQCEDLLRYFAARREPGLTLVELEALRCTHPADEAADQPQDRGAVPGDLLDATLTGAPGLPPSPGPGRLGLFGRRARPSTRCRGPRRRRQKRRLRSPPRGAQGRGEHQRRDRQ